MKSIFETAREDSRLSTSVRMVQVGGIAETLQGEGEYTAFFPIEEAYSEFPWTMLDAIMGDRERLTGMIRYHVVQGKLTVHELAQLEAIETLQGDFLDITGPITALQLNDATVIQPDIECTHGIYHIVARVLLPRG
ncbi:fasciclin domain-containing protein, partial [Methanoculleus sp.]|uniref:fasciclin domain-containing protein n=1 Tax=Methanoculleus sp. TaxID=90427 RepID=UPI00262DDAE4